MLYQTYELRVRPQICDLLADDKKNFLRPQICDLLADGKKNFLRPGPAKSRSRRLAASELADMKIWDTVIESCSSSFRFFFVRQNAETDRLRRSHTKTPSDQECGQKTGP